MKKTKITKNNYIKEKKSIGFRYKIGYGSQLVKSIYDVNHFSLLDLALKSAIAVDSNPVVKG